MKNLIKSIFFIAAAGYLSACTQNDSETDNTPLVPDANMVDLTISTGRPEAADTRTMLAVDGTTPLWCPGDAIGVSVLLNGTYTNHEFVNNNSETPCETTTFSGSTAVGETIYSYYPYSPNEITAEGKVIAVIPDVQHPTPTSFDGAADFLVGKPTDMPKETTTIEGLQFKRMIGVLRILLKDNTAEKIITGQNIRSISVTTESELAGGCYLDLVEGELGSIYSNESQTVTAIYSPDTQYSIGTETAATYFVVYPQNIKKGSTLKISAITEKYNIGREIELPYDIEINAGQIAALTITIKDENAVESDPKLLAVSIDGVQAVQVSETAFQIKMPYGADVTALNPEYITNGASVELKYEQNGSNDASTVDLSSPVVLTLASPTGQTKEYKIAVHYSNLPTVYLTTPSAIKSKTTWTTDCTIDIWNAGKLNNLYEDVQIKGRGNSTWNYVKKPYAIKLASKAEVLGMPKHKRWVLLANYLDATCLRNATAFEIARRLDGLAWTPHGQFVDIVMNGTLIGNYYLCEQIKVDKNRVNITEIDPEDTDEIGVTGGYIFELDTYYDEMFKFKTRYRELPVQFKDPDEDIADAQFNYVQNYFNKVEELLYGENPEAEDVFDYIDLNSYVDWYLVHVIALNYEASHPKSCYMHKDRGGKLIAGPVWDFDWGTFRITSTGLILKTALWYDKLFENPMFVDRLKERWAANKLQLEAVETFIAETAEQIRESAEGNKVMWPVSGSPNFDGELPFVEAAAQLKQAYHQRLERVGKAIEAL